MQEDRNSNDKRPRYTKLMRRHDIEGAEDSWVKLNRALRGRDVVFYSVVAQLATDAQDLDGEPVVLRIHRRFDVSDASAEAEATAYYEQVAAYPARYIVPPERVLVTKKAPWGRVSMIERTGVDEVGHTSETVFVIKSVATRRADRRQSTTLFRDKTEATEFFEAVTQPASYYPYEGILDRLEDAKLIRQGKKPKGRRTLALLLAVVLESGKRTVGKIVSKEVAEPERDSDDVVALTRDAGTTVLKILERYILLPPSGDAARLDQYVRAVARELLSVSIDKRGVRMPDAKLSKSTLRTRRTIFKAMFKVLTSYPLIFDQNLQVIGALAPNVADDELQIRISQGKATDVVHFKPMSPSAIADTIEKLPTLAMKCYCAKIFAFGFRADEADHLSVADLDRGMVVYEQVVSKTKYLRRGKLKKVNASLGLRILLRAERHLGISLTDKDRLYLVRLKKHVSYTRKEMRTTAAFRIAECTKDIQIVRKRLGHRLLDMAVRHYLAEDDDERTQETTATYYGFDSEEITLETDGRRVNLWDGEENLYDRFVLYAILGIFLDDSGLTAEQKKQFVEIVVEEYDERKGLTPGLGAAKKRNRTFKAS